MLPVVKGVKTTARRVLLYTLLTLAVTVLPGVTGTFGPVYLASAVLLGGIFLGLAWRLWRSPTRERAAVAFHYSLLYLALLFVGVSRQRRAVGGRGSVAGLNCPARRC